MSVHTKKGLLGVLSGVAVVIIMSSDVVLAVDDVVTYGESYTDGTTIQFAESDGSCFTWNNGMTFTFSLTAVVDAQSSGSAISATFTVDVYMWTGSRGGWLGGGSYPLTAAKGTKAMQPGAIVVGPLAYSNWNGSPASCLFEVYRTVTVTSPPGPSGWKSVLY